MDTKKMNPKEVKTTQAQQARQAEAIQSLHPAITDMLNAVGLDDQLVTDFKLHIPVDDTPTITVEVLVTENQMVRLAEIVKKYKLKVAEEEIIDAKVLEK